MKDQDKTKEQLIDELVELRQRIAELEKSETAHNQAVERYRTLIEGSLDMVQSCRLDGNFIYVNKAWLDTMGFSLKELPELTLFDVIHPDYLSHCKQLFSKVISGESQRNIEVIFITKDGREIFVEGNVSPYYLRGKIIGAQCFFRDITRRKQAGEALRYSSIQWQTTFDAMNDSVSLMNLEGKILQCNKAMMRLFGKPYNEIVGSFCWEIVHGASEPIEGCPFLRLKETRHRETRIFPIGDRWFEVTVDPKLDDESQLMGVVHIISDITKHKKAEEEKEKLQEQLIQSEKMAGIGTLTSGIAHEFNNLLQIMSGHAEFAQRTKKAEDMEEALDIVLSSSDKAAKIIRDLLVFSREEAPEKELCDITEEIEAVLSLTEEQLEKHNIKVVKKYERTPQIEVNKREMQQVFLNMVTNARDSMLPKGGRLEIKVKRVKGNVKVSFTDTGEGIEKEDLGKAFEPFYTTKGAIGGDSKIQGVGLGLSVSYGIVRRHGGTIEVKSEKGKETTFTVKLPLKGEETKKVRAKDKEKKKKKKPESMNILVVDDEEDICKMFTKWLSLEGHRVTSVLTGKNAIRLAEKKHFDIVFLDIVMPGVPGVEVLEIIKNISSETKVVIITGKLMDKVLVNELREKGASEFLQKPFKIEDIKKYIVSLGK